MEVEHKDNPGHSLANGGGKRGRGRPRGSPNKKPISVKEVSHSARASKRVDYFSPATDIKPKIKKRGRPKKIRTPGRPRKIPLTREEEEQRFLKLTKKRKLSKPLGRPRVRPVLDKPTKKGGRGRPRKYESMASPKGQVNQSPKSLKATEGGGKPKGSFKKKQGRPLGSPLAKRPLAGTPGKRGRPPGSANKLQVRHDVKGTPPKRGRPSASGNKLRALSGETNGTPKKRGRPAGSGMKVNVAATPETDGTPRKRGRPVGSLKKVKGRHLRMNGNPIKRGRPSGKGKTVTEEPENVLTNSPSSVGATPLKRGRPKKSEAFPANQGEEQEKSEENDEPSSKQACKGDAEPQKSSENDGDEVEEVYESPCRKSVFSRAKGKSPRKK